MALAQYVWALATDIGMLDRSEHLDSCPAVSATCYIPMLGVIMRSVHLCRNWQTCAA